MNKIKTYFSTWDAARVIKMVAGIAFIVGYISTKEGMYLFGGLFFGVKALLNIGCPGGSCATNMPKGEEDAVMKFDKYEPKKEKSDV